MDECWLFDALPSVEQVYSGEVSDEPKILMKSSRVLGLIAGFGGGIEGSREGEKFSWCPSQEALTVAYSVLPGSTPRGINS